MKLLMISGDRSICEGKQGAFWRTLNGLKNEWERIDVICPRPSQISKEELKIENVFFHPSPWSLPHQPQWILKKGSELFAAHRHDRMTVHEYPPFYNGIGAKRLNKRINIPYCLEVHHIVGWPRPANLTEAIGKVLSPWWLKHNAKTAANVRTVNEQVAQLLSSYGIPANKITVVPSFYLDSEDLIKTKALGDDWDVVFCARLVANKGLGAVLQAVASLPDCKLLIIGDGPLRKQFEFQVKRLGIANRVKFTGWLPTHQDVIAHIKSAKIFVMNSTSEGGPRSALEAMACGLPIISTRVGVMIETIKQGSNGFFTTGKPADLANRIAQLLADDPRRQLLGENATKVLAKYERGHLIKQYSDYLKNLA